MISTKGSSRQGSRTCLPSCPSSGAKGGSSWPSISLAYSAKGLSKFAPNSRCCDRYQLVERLFAFEAALRHGPPLVTAYSNMSIPAVLLPVFVQVGLSFVLLIWLAALRTSALRSGVVQTTDIALRERAWPQRA